MHQKLTITQPDDWHVHVREGEILNRVAKYTADQFGRALIMPNLTPPVTSVQHGLHYRTEILAAIPADSTFDPKMSLYLTDKTPISEIEQAAECPHVLGFKLYPAGATTNSSSGVTNVTKLMHVFEAMAKHQVVLQVHGEVTDSHVDIFDREAVFIEQILAPLHRELPQLKIVLEHITTTDGVAFVADSPANVAATITPHHLLFSRNEIFRDGIRPHAYCLPVLKRETHRLALLDAAISGDPSFFLGTDSAPHLRADKQSECGCAGIFSANAAIEIYAEIFSNMECIEKLEGFASHFGADFYDLQRNRRRITLERKPLTIPSQIGPGDSPAESQGPLDLVPLLAGVDDWLVSGKFQ